MNSNLSQANVTNPSSYAIIPEMYFSARHTVRKYIKKIGNIYNIIDVRADTFFFSFQVDLNLYFSRFCVMKTLTDQIIIIHL